MRGLRDIATTILTAAVLSVPLLQGFEQGDSPDEVAVDGGLELVIEPQLDAPLRFDSCLFGSPLLTQSRGEEVIVIVPERGAVTAISAATGAKVFEVALPAPIGEAAQTFATPVVAGNHVFVAYQTTREVMARGSLTE